MKMWEVVHCHLFFIVSFIIKALISLCITHYATGVTLLRTSALVLFCGYVLFPFTSVFCIYLQFSKIASGPVCHQGLYPSRRNQNIYKEPDSPGYWMGSLNILSWKKCLLTCFWIGISCVFSNLTHQLFRCMGQNCLENLQSHSQEVVCVIQDLFSTIQYTG